jgi:hypothetical protein
LKGREITLPARAISTKNKHLLASLRYQPAVSRRLFRCFGAHLLRSPWTVNPGSKLSACLVATFGQNPPAENLGSPTPDFGLVTVTSSRCRVLYYSQLLTFRSLSLATVVHGKTKNPATVSVSRV